jgi:hypothetical protein
MAKILWRPYPEKVGAKDGIHRGDDKEQEERVADRNEGGFDGGDHLVKVLECGEHTHDAAEA